MNEIVDRDAVELAAMLAGGELSAREVLAAHLAVIERVNPAVNAVVTLDAEGAMRAAALADERRARGEPPGPLHGLPVAIKDTHVTKGIRTTFGSTVHAGHVPGEDALIVRRLREAGAVIVGKTNTPEFAAGSQTYNEVFGATRNPYGTGRTCGGSSGGSAAAVASRMVPLADGSDLGGSLRNPASYCNIVGLRSSPGRVPMWPAWNAWDSMAVQGVLARTTADVALAMSAVAGPDPRAPLALDESGDIFRVDLAADMTGRRVACSPDLGGLFPVEPSVLAVFDRARETLADLGCVVEDDAPDLRGADEVFRTLRAAMFAVRYGPLLDEHRERLNPDVVGNIEDGFRLDGLAVTRAEVRRGEIQRRVLQFFDRYDHLMLPTVQLPPFPVERPYPERIADTEIAHYLDWMASCYLITVTGMPAVSVPAGFTADGLPVGVQIVAGPRGDLDALRLAHAFEQATGHARRRPPLPARS